MLDTFLVLFQNRFTSVTIDVLQNATNRRYIHVHVKKYNWLNFITLLEFQQTSISKCCWNVNWPQFHNAVGVSTDFMKLWRVYVTEGKENAFSYFVEGFLNYKNCTCIYRLVCRVTPHGYHANLYVNQYVQFLFNIWPVPFDFFLFVVCNTFGIITSLN